MRISSHLRTVLIGLSLAVIATLIVSRNTQVHANNRINNAQALATTSLQGCAWRETELGWQGAWNRLTIEKEGTQIFDAVWGKEGQKPVEATLEVTIKGNAVSILRRNKGKTAGTCNYTGTVSQDRTTVSGTYNCSGSTQNYSWSAEISEGCF